MNRKIILFAVFSIAAAMLVISCASGVPPKTYTSTPTPPTYTSPTPNTPPTTIPPPTTKTTTPPPPTTPTKTTASPASTQLYIPAGQQFTGGIMTQGGQSSFFIDKGPLCAFGGAPVLGYSWSLAAGSTIPPGTTSDPTTGMFYQGGAGIAIVPGTQTFKMVVSDGFSTATGTFSLVVNTGAILGQADFQKSLAADIPLPAAKVGMGYGASLRAIGNGALPWKWTVMDGNLPPGLGLNSASGVVYGTPLASAAGNTYKFRISVRDGIGAEAIGEPTYSIVVSK